jgi:hypothetical protein
VRTAADKFSDLLPLIGGEALEALLDGVRLDATKCSHPLGQVPQDRDRPIRTGFEDRPKFSQFLPNHLHPASRQIVPVKRIKHWLVQYRVILIRPVFVVPVKGNILAHPLKPHNRNSGNCNSENAGLGGLSISVNIFPGMNAGDFMPP